MQLIILILLILLNAFFAVNEIAFISLNDAKIEALAKEGDKKAKKIQKMLEKPSRFLATIQIGITFGGFLSSALASDTFGRKLAPLLHNIFPALTVETWSGIAIVIITIVLSYFTLIFGELVPKSIPKKLVVYECSVDLTKKAKNMEFDPLIGRDKEVDELIEVLK